MAAIGLFALFALAGGWAVSATGTLSSLSDAPVTAAWHGHDVIDVAMIDGDWDLLTSASWSTNKVRCCTFNTRKERVA